MIIFWKCLENEFGIEYAASASCFALEREAVHSFYPDIAPWPELHAAASSHGLLSPVIRLPSNGKFRVYG
jgi:hypothetical protein